MTADLPVTGVKAWLEQDWQYAKTRPYTAEDVAEHIALDLPISNDMPFALRNLLAEQFEAGTCATAIGCAEPTLLYAAAQHGMRRSSI
jgi:isocitrate lyase